MYKALDIRRELYDNTQWERKLTTSTTESRALSQYVALKRIYATSSPARIANEISILHDLKSGTCVAPLITAFRDNDQMFIVMPYIPHDDFRVFLLLYIIIFNWLKNALFRKHITPWI